MNMIEGWTDDDGRVHVRNSERGTLDRCPQQWQWSWREGLRAKETAKPLWFGTAIHEALAAYYKPGTKRASLKKTLEVFRGSADMEAEYIRTNVGDLDEEEWVDARVLGESMLTRYIEFYGGDRDWDVIATEQTFEIAVQYSWGPSTEWLRKWMKSAGIKTDYFLLNGTFDGVYRDKRDNRIKLMEHKTAKSISVSHLPMDNQAGTYWLVASSVGHDQGWLGKREQISEITYNFLRKAIPDDRPRDAQGYATNKPIKVHFIDALEDLVELTGKETLDTLKSLADEQNLTVLGDRSKTQPPPMYERHPVRKSKGMKRMQMHRLQQEVLRMNALVVGALDVTKAPSRDHCGFCPFREMCELHESGAGWTEFRDAMYRSTDPYADHRKSASVA
jgi:hypothetical protein